MEWNDVEHIFDDNGNAVSTRLYDTEEEARAALATLANCTYCTDCWHCTYCTYCMDY